MGLGLINWQRRNRQAAAQPQLEPDYTQPEELRARSRAEQPPKKKSFPDRHPFAAGFLAGLGGPEASERFLRARQGRLERERRSEETTLEEARRAREAQDEQAIKLMDPSLASNTTLAEAIARARQADEDLQRKLEAAQVPGYTNVAGKLIQEKAPTKAEKPKGVMAVGPEQGIYDRDTGEFIREPKFRPRARTSPRGGGSSETGREKHIAGANQAKATSRHLNDLMHAITNEARREPGGWEKPYGGEEKSVAGLTRRQAYESLKKQNQDAVAEINRQWNEAGGMGGEPILNAGPGVRNAAESPDEEAVQLPQLPALPSALEADIGYTKDQIEALRQAMDDDDRDEFDSYSPEDKKKVLDGAYGRNVRR
jgi:hypothetical protein